MSYINEERPKVTAMMNMFGVLNKLNKMYTIDQAMDVLDAYFKTGNSNYLPPQENVRDFVVESNMRETFQPIYEEYNHFADYLEGLLPSKEKTK